MMMDGFGADDDAVSRPRHRSTEHSAGVDARVAEVHYHCPIPLWGEYESTGLGQGCGVGH